jgi:hypothetical protein
MVQILSRAQTKLATAMADGTTLESVDLDKYSLLGEESEKYIGTPDGRGKTGDNDFNYIPTEDPYLFEFSVAAGDDIDTESPGVQVSKNIVFASSKNIESAPDRYLKFVSQYDLKQYGATETGEDGVFEWTSDSYATQDGQPLVDLEHQRPPIAHLSPFQGRS